MKFMRKTGIILFFICICSLGAQKIDLRIADASRSGIPALRELAFRIALAQKLAISVDNVTPDEAKTRLTEGRADLIVLEHGNLPENSRKQAHLFAAEVFAVYVHRANPLLNLSREQLRDILTARRPPWSICLPEKRTDIHRFGLRDSVPGYRLGESLLGVDSFAEDIFRSASTADSLILVSGDPEALGFGVLQRELPANVRILSIGGVAPDKKNICSGKYLCAWRYYIIGKSVCSPAAQLFLKETGKNSFSRMLENSGFTPLLKR